MNDALAPLPYQPYLDELTQFAGEEERRPQLIEAKAEYARLTGEVFEDDKQFETRMSSFLEHYLFDRLLPSGKTPAREYYERVRTLDSMRGEFFHHFTETLHSLFEVRKLGKGMVRLRNVFDGKDYEVTERRQMVGLAKADLLEARLIPFSGHLWFSAAFICHPREVTKNIWAEVKRRKKKEPARPHEELMWECAKMSLKADRYRQIPLEKIYDFENKVL